MNKRILSLILAALMLSPAFLTGCSENSADSNETDASAPSAAEDAVQEEETELTRANTPDDLPELNFDGETATIAARTKSWFTGEMYVEELNGETVNDAVFERDLTVENRFNVTINYELLDDTQTPVNLNVTSGTDFYTLHVGSAVDTVQYGVQGNYYNLLGTYPEYLNLSQPWWSQYYTEQSRIKDVSFFATGDLCFSLTKLAFVTFTNMQMVENLNIEDPFELVRSGDWTFDKQMELASSAYLDKNGDGIANDGDTFGMSLGGLIGLDLYWSAFDLSIIARDEENAPVAGFDVERMSSVIEKLNSFYKQVDYVFCPAAYGTDSEQDDIAKMLSEDRMLFSPLRVMHTEQIRDMESSYALLPLPKWDTEQEEYYTFVHDQYSIVGIPLSVQNPAMASAVMEAMAAESYRFVTPAYYDIVLNGKYIRDPNSGEMLDIAMEGIKIDFGWIYTYSLSSIAQEMLRNILYNGKAATVASSFRSREKVTTKVLEKLVKNIDKISEDR